MLVLDIVVAVEIAEKEVQPRREEFCEFRRGHPPFAIVGDDIGQHAAELAEHVVPLQPHIGHAVDIGVGLPVLARIFFGEEAQIVRQAGAAFQFKGKFIGHDGFLW